MRKRIWIAITVALWLAWLITRRDRCEPAWFDFAIDVDGCPDGDVRATAELQVAELRRGAPGRIGLRVIAHYTTGDRDGEQRADVYGARVTETWLTDAHGQAHDQTPLTVAWDDGAGALWGKLSLPAVPDGNYELHAR